MAVNACWGSLCISTLNQLIPSDQKRQDRAPREKGEEGEGEGEERHVGRLRG